MENDTRTIIDALIYIEKYKSYFSRNLFRSNLNNFTKDEMKYLLIIFDSLHNIPEYIEKFYSISEGNNEDMSNFKSEIKIFENLKSIITDLNHVEKDLQIHIDNPIRSWAYELERMIPYIDLLIGLK